MHRGVLFGVGDKVRARSGGPVMLVVDLDFERGQRICAWKSGDAVSEQTFSIASLLHAGVQA